MYAGGHRGAQEAADGVAGVGGLHRVEGGLVVGDVGREGSLAGAACVGPTTDSSADALTAMTMGRRDERAARLLDILVPLKQFGGMMIGLVTCDRP